MNIVLIGFMCSGKTKVGKLLAKKLGWTHIDTDGMIEKQVGASIADIINTQGEKAFRDIEKKAVSLVSMGDKSVISTGGGVPLSPINMKELSSRGKVIWLKVSPEVVLKRVGDIKKRPLINPKDPLQSIQKTLKSRIPAYEVADYSIDTDHLKPQGVVDQIINEAHPC